MKDLSIIEADLKNPAHAQAFIVLLNIYILDDMGGGIPFSGERAQSLLDALSAQPSGIILLANRKGQSVGMLVAFITYSTFKNCPVCNIHDIVVRPEFRGQGVGRALIQFVESQASARGCGKMTLEVRFDNEQARGLYLSLGYGECDVPMSFWVKSL